MRKRLFAAISIITALAIPFSYLPANAASETPQITATAPIPPGPPASSALPTKPISSTTSAIVIWGGVTRLGTVQAHPSIAPVVVAILSLIVREGIRQAIKVFGKNAVKKALRSKLISANANKWSHILDPKHNWHRLDAQNDRDKVADLLSSAVTNGKQYPRGKAAYEYHWATQGETVIATVSRSTGEISNGWVKE